MENHPFSWWNPLQMAILHSYVNLPEGTGRSGKSRLAERRKTNSVTNFTISHPYLIHISSISHPYLIHISPYLTIWYHQCIASTQNSFFGKDIKHQTSPRALQGYSPLSGPGKSCDSWSLSATKPEVRSTWPSRGISYFIALQIIRYGVIGWGCAGYDGIYDDPPWVPNIWYIDIYVYMYIYICICIYVWIWCIYIYIYGYDIYIWYMIYGQNNPKYKKQPMTSDLRLFFLGHDLIFL